MSEVRKGAAHWSLALLALLSFARASEAAPPADVEAGVVADALYHVAMFTTWPAATNRQEETVVCVMAENSDALIRALRSRALRVFSLSRSEFSLKGCHVLFVDLRRHPEDKLTDKLTDKLRRTGPILTVSSSPELPVLVLLRYVAGRITLTLDTARARQLGFSFSSELLGLSIVRTKP